MLAPISAAVPERKINPLPLARPGASWVLCFSGRIRFVFPLRLQELTGTIIEVFGCARSL